jgi:hypothetical protein
MEALQHGDVSINQVLGLLGIGRTPFANEFEQMMMRIESSEPIGPHCYGSITSWLSWPNGRWKSSGQLCVSSLQLRNKCRDWSGTLQRAFSNLH